MTILREFASYGAREAERVLPADVLHHTKRAVLDWFSALYPGTRVSPGLNLVRAHHAELGLGRSTLPGFGTTTFPATAAWINGSTSHAVEFDDIFRDAAYHPGCPVIAAALAVAEDLNSSGESFLKAVVIGYEISTRIGAAVQPAHYQYFHTTGTVGCMGAAAAAAALLAPGNPDVMLHAISTATTFASGLQQAFRSDAMTKALHAGHAAEVGVRAAQAATAGVTGVLDILEGSAGFGAAMAQSPDWSSVTRDVGERYNITSITQKNHGCCGHTFAALDAMIALREAHQVRPEDISTIEVETYQTAIDVTGNFNPRSVFEAKFSLPYVISHALQHGSVRLATFDDVHLYSDITRELMRRVVLRADSAMTSGFPRQRAAKVSLRLRTGQVFEHFAPCRRGDPEAPLTDEELNNKFDELVFPVLGQTHGAQLREQIWGLEQLNHMADLNI